MNRLEMALGLMYARRSIRSYVDGKPVERDKIVSMLKAAMAAPSACNLQPWEFVVVDEPDGVKALKECIDEGNGRHYNAPAGMIVCANTRYIPWESDGATDCTAAIENMLLAAEAMGLGAVWIGAIDADEIRKRFDIPAHVAVNSAVLFGYPAETKPARTQYAEEAVYWQKYDPDREHAERTTALRFL